MTNAEKYYLLLADYYPTEEQSYTIYSYNEEAKAKEDYEQCKDVWEEAILIKGVEIIKND